MFSDSEAKNRDPRYLSLLTAQNAKFSSQTKTSDFVHKFHTVEIVASELNKYGAILCQNTIMKNIFPLLYCL